MNMRMWVVGLVATLVLGACGGGDDGPSSASEEPEPTTAASEAASAAPTQVAAAPTTDEWVEQALVECKAVNQATTAAEPKGDPFSPKATEEDKEQAITFLTTFAESLRTFAGNLEELGYPAEDAEAAERLVTAAEESAQAFDDAAAVAEKNFAQAQAPVGKAFGSIGQVSAAAKEIGIADLENCKREGKKTEEVAAGATEVPVLAKKEGKKYVFEFEQPVPAGKTAFVLNNEDDEAHFIALVQMTGPGTLAKALKAEAQGNSKGADKFIKNEDVGGVEEAAPGESNVGNVNLQPGTYGMLCFIPGPDGKPHAFNGMAVEFEVQ